jgi:hypothetical protein
MWEGLESQITTENWVVVLMVIFNLWISWLSLFCDKRITKEVIKWIYAQNWGTYLRNWHWNKPVHTLHFFFLWTRMGYSRVVVRVTSQIIVTQNMVCEPPPWCDEYRHWELLETIIIIEMAVTSEYVIMFLVIYFHWILQNSW